MGAKSFRWSINSLFAWSLLQFGLLYWCDDASRGHGAKLPILFLIEFVSTWILMWRFLARQNFKPTPTKYPLGSHLMIGWILLMIITKFIIERSFEGAFDAKTGYRLSTNWPLEHSLDLVGLTINFIGIIVIWFYLRPRWKQQSSLPGAVQP